MKTARKHSSAASRASAVFNGDCNFFFYNPELWQPEGGRFGAQAMHRCVQQLAACGVDTFAINPNTQVAWYPSQHLPHILQGYRRGDRGFARRIARANAALQPTQLPTFTELIVEMLDRYLDLAEDGVDWLKTATAACRAQGVSPWLSYRMNPTHFSGHPASPANARVFRAAANRLSGRIHRTRTYDPAWRGLNFGRAAVRNYVGAMIAEGITSYDCDAVQLDWLRHPLAIEPPASASEIRAMVDWIAELRAHANRRGRAFGLRIPARLAYLREIGLDLSAMAKRGLLDFVTISNFWQTPWSLPVAEFRAALGPDVKILGGIEGAPNWLEAAAPTLRGRQRLQEIQLAGDSARFTKSKTPARVRGTRYLAASAELVRGAAASTLVQGADGVEFFNFYVVDQVRVPGQMAVYPALRNSTNLRQLRNAKKHYALNIASGASHERWDVPAPLPRDLAPGTQASFSLHCLDQPRGRIIVQVVTSRSAKLAIALNRRPLRAGRATKKLLFPAGPYSHHVPENCALNFVEQARQLVRGENTITLRNRSRRSCRVIAIELAVHPQ